MKICSDCQRCYDDPASACEERGHPPLRPIRPGSTRIGDRYRIDRHLGRGGTGSVFAGRHLELDRPVAIKLLPPELVPDPAAAERFRREARAAARISHPNVGGIYDYGVLPDGEAYIVMELIEGETLSELLDASGPLPVPAAAEIGRQVAQGIAAAHRAGVIHRDLKPSNILLTREIGGRCMARIVNFSIARPEEQDGRAAPTLSRVSLGTPRYMSPEHCEGRPLDARCDVYSLGVILYEMLAGRPPFDLQTPAAVALRPVRSSPGPLQNHRPDVPDGLAWLVTRCLLKSPGGRPQTAAELAERLLPFETGGMESMKNLIIDSSNH